MCWSAACRARSRPRWRRASTVRPCTSWIRARRRSNGWRRGGVSWCVSPNAFPGVPAIDVVHALTEGAQASALSVLYCLHDASARQERERAERLGIRTFLTHPIDVDELAEKVRALTHGANGCRSGDPAAEGSAGACPKRRRRAW